MSQNKKMCILVNPAVYEELTKTANARFQSTSSLISQRLTASTLFIEQSRSLNPYPSDIFTEMPEEDWRKVAEALQTAGLSSERVFGNWGRRVWNNCIETIIKKFFE